jgi:hypothetical protein
LLHHGDEPRTGIVSLLVHHHFLELFIEIDAFDATLCLLRVRQACALRILIEIDRGRPAGNILIEGCRIVGEARGSPRKGAGLRERMGLIERILTEARFEEVFQSLDLVSIPEARSGPEATVEGETTLGVRTETVDLVTDILTPLQKNVLTALYREGWFREHFYLTGGTALAAVYLQHRFSDDLDFFSHEVSLDAIDGLIQAVARQSDLRVAQLQKSPGFLRYEVNQELKVDFVGDVPFRVGTPEIIDSFVVDSVKNIAVNKVCAILGRLEAKDYVDLYFIQQQYQFDIFELLDLGQKKDAGLEPFV